MVGENKMTEEIQVDGVDYVDVFEEDVTDNDYTMTISGSGHTIEYPISKELYEMIKEDWG